MSNMSRRNVLASIAAGFILMIGIARSALARLVATPEQTEGPFYPDVMPRDTDNDLVKIEGAVREAGGEILRLDGRVLNSRGEPVANALVEIWQADVNGRYAHSDDRQRVARDENFQGYGRMRTDAEGRYSFRTIKPVPYPGRTPHIHFKVQEPGGAALTTQMYIPDDPRNARDFIYRSLSPEERAAATAKMARLASGDWAGSFDIVLG